MSDDLVRKLTDALRTVSYEAVQDRGSAEAIARVAAEVAREHIALELDGHDQAYRYAKASYDGAVAEVDRLRTALTEATTMLRRWSDMINWDHYDLSTMRSEIDALCDLERRAETPS